MNFNRLGATDIEISEICLGSMTWGTQNSESQGHEQMDYALAHNVNFIDTAEVYPTTPAGADVLGSTEAIIGSWFAARGNRDKVVLATKVTGQGNKLVRDGAPISGTSIRTALEGSLKRLQTDYVDIYQLHWPNRGHYAFRRHWGYDPSTQERTEVEPHMVEVLETIHALVKEGKIRHFGLSNETAWGVTQWCRVADKHGLPRPVSIQNEYSLLQRIYDLDLAEVSHHEQVGLLAYSPLAAGMLTGKYRNGALPAGSRMTINNNLGGRVSPHSEPVCNAYVSLAEAEGLDPAQMALAFCLTRPFMTSVIIGATTMEQLQINIASADIELSDEVIAEITKIHRNHPVPM